MMLINTIVVMTYFINIDDDDDYDAGDESTFVMMISARQSIIEHR